MLCVLLYLTNNATRMCEKGPHYGPGVDRASNRNEYQEYFVGVKAAGA